MYLVVNKIGILWLIFHFFGVFSTQLAQYHGIPYKLQFDDTQVYPKYAILQPNSKKISQHFSNPSKDLNNKYKYKFASNSEQDKLDLLKLDNHRPRQKELDEDLFYDFYANDKSYKLDQTSEKEENVPHSNFQELDKLKSQPRKAVNYSLLKKSKIKERISENNSSGKTSENDNKRVPRQTQKQRPGFFWTLFRVAFETVNDTRSSINQISELLNNGIAPDPTTKKPGANSMIVETTTMKTNSTNGTSDSITTTSEAPFVLTRSGLQGIIRRNVKGLVRLFNIEWKDALNQSQVTAKEFQRDLGNQIGTFLRDNPNAYK